MTENEITGLLIQLADLGITGINVYYEGGGDSGAIENICYSKKSNIDFDEIMDIDVYEKSHCLNNLDSVIYNNLENFAQEKILEDIEDWWNNEGGYGYLCIKVPSGEYTIFNNINIVTTEEFTHEGGLIDKTLN
jgi:hypothetical protein